MPSKTDPTTSYSQWRLSVSLVVVVAALMVINLAANANFEMPFPRQNYLSFSSYYQRIIDEEKEEDLLEGPFLQPPDSYYKDLDKIRRSSSSFKTILFYTPFWEREDYGFGLGHQPFVKNECQEQSSTHI